MNINFDIEGELQKQFEKRLELTGNSKSAIAREALVQYLHVGGENAGAQD